MMPASRMMAGDMLQDWVDDEKLLAHLFAVENIMRWFAEKYKLDDREVKKWGILGLLHDLDYQDAPERHCFAAQEAMTQAGYDEDFIRAVMSHEYKVCTDVEPISDMEKVLYTVNYLAVLISEAVMSLPSKDINDLTPEYLKEKYNDNDFAPEANRDVIRRGLGMMGASFEDTAQTALDSMKEIGYSIGLEPDEDE